MLQKKRVIKCVCVRSVCREAAHGPDTSNYRKYVQVFNYRFIKKSQTTTGTLRSTYTTQNIILLRRLKYTYISLVCAHTRCWLLSLSPVSSWQARCIHIFSYVIILPFLLFYYFLTFPLSLLLLRKGPFLRGVLYTFSLSSSSSLSLCAHSHRNHHHHHIIVLMYAFYVLS